MTRSRRRPLAVVLVVGLLTGCSASSNAAPASSVSSPAAPASSGAAIISGPGTLSYDGVTVNGDVGREPAFLIGDEAQQSSRIQVRDVVVGSGATATATRHVTVEYAARGARSKRTFDSSWLRGKPFTFVPSKIAFSAFSSGVPGMRVGGRRLVIVPGPLAFAGKPPAGSGLAANETVAFVIDLVSA